MKNFGQHAIHVEYTSPNENNLEKIQFGRYEVNKSTVVSIFFELQQTEQDSEESKCLQLALRKSFDETKYQVSWDSPCVLALAFFSTDLCPSDTGVFSSDDFEKLAKNNQMTQINLTIVCRIWQHCPYCFILILATISAAVQNLPESKIGGKELLTLYKHPSACAPEKSYFKALTKIINVTHHWRSKKIEVDLSLIEDENSLIIKPSTSGTHRTNTLGRRQTPLPLEVYATPPHESRDPNQPIIFVALASYLKRPDFR
ncbi:hypothetical protein WN51_14260 [Melipona quadrifasciata]|uniref:Uncharacterized protein n=1 Tax=Melipona quadrifasciata TaxID=166423 RepID=A0A0M9A2V0_9HYME|nr:hypothetical protein WN51_14260 [Melipona quadrifasciata]